MILDTSQSTQETKKLGIYYLVIIVINYGQHKNIIWSKYPKIDIAPSFFTITDHNLGPVSIPVTPIASNVILDT